MTLHLLKMCVGIDSIAHLKRAQGARLEAMGEAGEPPRLRHWTRNRPRCAEEVVAGGSIYWIIRGYIQVRQRIVEIERVDRTGTLKKCALVLDPELVETVPRRVRPIQGWRYLEPANAPPDRGPVRAELDDIPESMARELRDLGLL